MHDGILVTRLGRHENLAELVAFFHRGVFALVSEIWPDCYGLILLSLNSLLQNLLYDYVINCFLYLYINK